VGSSSEESFYGDAHRWGGGAGGVVEVAGEVVGEKLLGDAELMAGSGNNRRRLP
jgi:hypothetical protein